MLQKGCVVVASVSGYEELLAQAELEHTHAILKNLLNTVIDDISHPLVLSEMEVNPIFL
jgi:hypothetical protein